MSEREDSDDLRLLQDARRALAPSPDDARRLLALTKARIAAEAPATSAPAGTASATLAAGGAALTVRAWLMRGTFVVAIAATGGVIGYQLGWRAALDTQPRAAAIERPAPPALAAAAGEPKPAPAPSPAARPAEPISAAGHPARANPSNRRAPTAAAAPAAPPSLDEELRALRLVERALREGESVRALELLGELDRTAPEGRLQEERFAAFMRARCAVGAGTPATLARDFEARYPDSVYLARVRQSCGVAAETRVMPTRPLTDRLVPGDSLRGTQESDR